MFMLKNELMRRPIAARGTDQNFRVSNSHSLLAKDHCRRVYYLRSAKTKNGWRVGHITGGRYRWVCVGALTETKPGVPDFSHFSRSRPLAANAQAGVFKLFSTQWPKPRYPLAMCEHD
jgi:hypothetical protein